MPGRVGAVDDRDDPGVTCTSAQVLDREAARSLRRDVTDEQDARPLVRPGPEVVQRLEGPADVLEPTPLRQVLPDEVVRPVLVVGRQHLVAGTEPQRARDRVHADRHVLHEEQALGIRAHELGQLGAGFPDRVRDTSEELRRLPLELALEALIFLEHRQRAGSERAVIQVRPLGVEQVEVAHRPDASLRRRPAFVRTYARRVAGRLMRVPWRT
jgi:hypothetical protein